MKKRMVERRIIAVIAVVVGAALGYYVAKEAGAIIGFLIGLVIADKIRR